jgi:hypothetical protein
MQLTILSPTYYKDTEPFKYFELSANHFNIVPHAYGYGRQFTDWIQTHIYGCLDVLYQTVNSHVLFTDSSDVMFLKPKAEIIQRYNRMGHPPMLVSVEDSGMNAGGWMGETEVAIAILEHLKGMDIPKAGDPQERWRKAIGRGDIKVDWDFENLIFAVNKWPTDACILHCAGGYSDPKTGRQERLAPIWRELGY